MRSLARALSSSRRPPPNAASKPCSAIASSSVTDCSRLRLARGPVSSTTRPVSIDSCTLATTSRAPTRRDELVAVLDDLGEVVAGVDVHHRERQACRGERQHGEVQQHGGVLAAAEQQHRVLALGRDLADDGDGLVGQRLEVGQDAARSSRRAHTCSPHSVLALPAQRPPRLVLAGGDRTRARPAADRRIPTLAERVDGQLVELGVQRHVVVGPRRQRVDLDEVAIDVVADDRRVGTSRAVDATHARDPRGLAVERAVERLDLADGAARLDVGLPQVVAAGSRGSGVTTRRLRSNRFVQLLDEPPASRRTGTACRAARCRRPGSALAARCTSTASSKLAVTATFVDAVGVERPAQHLRRVQLLDVVREAWSRLTPASYRITTNSIKIDAIRSLVACRAWRSTTRSCSISTGSRYWSSGVAGSPCARSKACSRPVPTSLSWPRGGRRHSRSSRRCRVVAAYETGDLDPMPLGDHRHRRSGGQRRRRRRRHGRERLGQPRRRSRQLHVHPAGGRPTTASSRSQSAPAGRARRWRRTCAANRRDDGSPRSARRRGDHARPRSGPRSRPPAVDRRRRLVRPSATPRCRRQP